MGFNRQFGDANAIHDRVWLVLLRADDTSTVAGSHATAKTATLSTLWCPLAALGSGRLSEGFDP